MSERLTLRRIPVLGEAPLTSTDLRIFATNYETVLGMTKRLQPNPEVLAEQVSRIRALADWLDRVPKVELVPPETL